MNLIFFCRLLPELCEYLDIVLVFKKNSVPLINDFMYLKLFRKVQGSNPWKFCAWFLQSKMAISDRDQELEIVRVFSIKMGLFCKSLYGNCVEMTSLQKKNTKGSISRLKLTQLISCFPNRRLNRYWQTVWMKKRQSNMCQSMGF